MPDLKTVADSLLISVAGVDMKTAGTTSMYTVPVGKSCVITAIIVRNPSASLAGGSSYSFGSGANFNTFAAGISLADMTTLVSDIKMIVQGTNNAKYIISAAGAIIGMKVTTGSTLAATATIEILGYLV
jgi:hypothetical protein